MDPAANRLQHVGRAVALRSMAWTACFSIFFNEALNHPVMGPFFSWLENSHPVPITLTQGSQKKNRRRVVFQHPEVKKVQHKSKNLNPWVGVFPKTKG